MDKLLKNVPASQKLSETALLCHADIMRAAAYIPSEHDAALRNSALEIAHIMKVWFS